MRPPPRGPIRCRPNLSFFTNSPGTAVTWPEALVFFRHSAFGLRVSRLNFCPHATCKINPAPQFPLDFPATLRQLLSKHPFTYGHKVGTHKPARGGPSASQPFESDWHGTVGHRFLRPRCGSLSGRVFPGGAGIHVDQALGICSSVVQHLNHSLQHWPVFGD